MVSRLWNHAPIFFSVDHRIERLFDELIYDQTEGVAPIRRESLSIGNSRLADQMIGAVLREETVQNSLPADESHWPFRADFPDTRQMR